MQKTRQIQRKFLKKPELLAVAHVNMEFFDKYSLKTRQIQRKFLKKPELLAVAHVNMEFFDKYSLK